MLHTPEAAKLTKTSAKATRRSKRPPNSVLTHLRAKADDGVQARQLSSMQTQADVALQGKFVGADGDWMQDVSDEVLIEKFGATTRALWSALRKSSEFVIIKKSGSGAAYSFSTKELFINSDWYNAIKTYVETGEKSGSLGDAIAAFTHEMSHAHDVRVKGETPEGKDKGTDAYVTAVMKTELKAWMKEARSARENSRMADDDAKIAIGNNSSRLIKGWLAVYFTLQASGNILAISASNNIVVGRLQKYFLDNKSTVTSTDLAGLLAANGGDLMNDIANYAGQIRAKFTSGDTDVKRLCAAEMK